MIAATKIFTIIAVVLLHTEPFVTGKQEKSHPCIIHKRTCSVQSVKTIDSSIDSEHFIYSKTDTGSVPKIFGDVHIILEGDVLCDIVMAHVLGT